MRTKVSPQKKPSLGNCNHKAMSEFSVDAVIEPVEMTFFTLNLGGFDSAKPPLMNHQPFLRT